MKLAWNHEEREIYDYTQWPPPPYPSSKSIPDESTGADRAPVYSAAPLSRCAAEGKPVAAAFLAFNQVIGTVQPIAQAQGYRSQQVHSSNEANSHSLNTFGFQAISQPTWQTIPAPGRKQVTLQNKDRTVSNKAVQPFAQNGIVWMTAIGQMVQTVNNIHGVHSARMKQSYNPVVECQNQNVDPSSNMHISIATSGSVAQTSVAHAQLNGSDSQGNCSPSLKQTANAFVGSNNQTQIQSAFRKKDLFQDQSKAVSTIAGTTPAPVFQRGWPDLTSHAPVPAHAHGAPARSNSFVWARSSLSLSSQQHGQQSFTNSFTLPNSNGQKSMVLARVIPMSHDWNNLQQIPTSLPSVDQIKLKNLQVEGAPLHHTSGNGQQSRTLNNAISAFETLFENFNTATPRTPAARTSARRNCPILPALLPPPLKPSLHEQQNVQNICTPATLSKNCTPILPSNLKVQHNVIGPWNLNANSKESVASPLPPLLVGHDNFSVSSTDSDLVTQQMGTVTSLRIGSPCNSQSVLPAPDVPHTMNMLHSPFKLPVESKDEGEKSVHVVSSGSGPSPVGFDNENPKPLPVQLSARDDCGKERTADLLPVIPPQVVVHNCQSTESSRVYTPPSMLTHEKDLPVQATEGQVHHTAVKALTSMLGTSKYLALSDANLSSLAGQHCEETSARGSSNVDERSERQKSLASPSPVQASDCSDKIEAANVGDQPEIFITGVFSLRDDTELWGSVQASSPDSIVDPINPATGSTNLATEEVNNLSSFKGLVTLESGLDDTVSQVKECKTAVVEENGQIMCKPPSHLESRQQLSVTESPGTVHMQPALESSFDKNVDQLPYDSNDPVNILIDLTEDKDYSTNSALPSDLKESKTKLDSDKSHIPFEINSQNPLTFDKGTQDLDELLHSVEMEIEAILNFWNPSHGCGNTEMLAYKPNNLQGGRCESKLPNIEETALKSCVSDKFDKAAPLVDSDCDVSTYVKVLGHAEILNLLAEISKSNSNERLPVEGAESELFIHSTVRVNEEVRRKASENANNESKESSAMVQEIKEYGHGEEQDQPPLPGLDNEQSSTTKGKQKGKKIYCCINAWLVASGVLGVYCNCKLSQRNKPEKLADLPATLHKTQSNTETSNQSCTINQMEVESSFNRVPFVTHEKVLETAENRNTSPRVVPDNNWEKVPQKKFSVDAIEQSGEVREKTSEGNKMESQWKPSITNLNGFCTSEGSDRLTGVVTLQDEPDQNKAEENKSTSLGAVDIGPEKEEYIVVLDKELNDNTTKNVRRDPSRNVLNEKSSDKTDAQHVEQHIDEVGFKGCEREAEHLEETNAITGRMCKSHIHKTEVMKRKSDSSNCRSSPKKRKIGVQDAKFLPNYNCRIVIQEKTCSSSGEHAVRINLLPITGQPHNGVLKVKVNPK